MKYKNKLMLCALEQKQKQVEEMKEFINEDIQNLNQVNQLLKVDGNSIYIYTDIDDKSLLFLKTSIQKIVLNYKQIQILYPGIKKKYLPIDVHIASNGGDLFSGLGMYDILKNCQYQINTYIQGFAASAATFLFLGGKSRHMTQNSFILIHQYSTIASGTHKTLQDTVQSGNKFMNKLKKIYLSSLNISEQKLDELLQRDLWLTFQQAKQLGFVNT